MRLIEQDWTDIYATTAAHYRWTVQEFATEMERRAVQLGVRRKCFPLQQKTTF
jgi:hypothetical protein